jgi:hypothetical protein
MSQQDGAQAGTHVAEEHHAVGRHRVPSTDTAPAALCTPTPFTLQFISPAIGP